MLKKIVPLLFVFFLASCVKDVDFDQAENIVITPTLDASLIFFDFPASQFSEPTGTAIVTESDEIEFDVFTEEFLRENLIKAEFFFEITNSIDRNFRADVIMYDAGDQVTHAFAINVVPDGNNSVTVEHTEVFEDALLEQLKNTVRMEFILNMLPSPTGIPIDDTSVGRIKMRSKATLFFRIDS